MNGFTLLILLFIVIYIASKYLKGPANNDYRQDDFNMRPFGGTDGWNGNAPSELPENDETEVEMDGEDLEEIGYEKDAADDAEDIYKFTEMVIQKVTIPEKSAAEIPEPEQETPVSPTPEPEQETPASPAPEITPPAEAPAAQPEAPAPYISMQDQQIQDVVIDSEVRIDTHMPPDNN